MFRVVRLYKVVGNLVCKGEVPKFEISREIK